MDIQIPHSLLLKHLETRATPQEIAKSLSLCGPTVDTLEKTGDDWLYHLEIITNRVDAASVRGVAREAAAILPEFNHPAKLIPLNLAPIEKVIKTATQPLDLKVVNNPVLNHRILAIKLSDVSIKPSPSWLQSALEKFGQRPLNNLIDVTNYVMFELGHPVHAFDYDRLTTKRIIVREAKRGERVITLDAKTHILKGGEAVYDDGTGRIVDLPGIMGTQNSVITNQTKNVLLWIESCDNQKIRFASLTHQLRTQAAILNEKQVDPELAYPAILRSVELMLQVGGGSVASKLLDIYPLPPQPKKVTLDFIWLNRFIGITLPKNRAVTILNRLGFKLVGDHESVLDFQIPTWRINDISLKEDLAEEVARVYGYYRLPSVLPPTTLPQTETSSLLVNEVSARTYLANLGFTEIYNYSLVSRELYQKSGLSVKPLFHLNNPLSNDYEYMRDSLLPSLLGNLQTNRGLVNPPLRLFELANIYLPDKSGPLAHERSTLALVTLGDDFGKVKGYVEALAHHLLIKLTFNPGSTEGSIFEPSKTAVINVDKQLIGHLGLVKTAILSNFQLDQPVVALELNFERLNWSVAQIHHFSPVPQYPGIVEDLTFTLPPKTYIGPVIASLKQTHQLIESVKLKTIYRDNFTFTLTYRHPQHTLTDQEIGEVRQLIVSAAKAKFKAILVGKLKN